MQFAFNALPGVLRDRRTFILILAVTTIAVVACRGSGSNPSASDQDLPVIDVTVSPAECINNVQPEGAPTFDEIDFDRLQPQQEGLRVYEIEAGTGDTPSIADAVSVEYTGWLENGCMFDTSYPNEGPTTFPLLNVIRGWQQGFSTMQEGGSRVLEIGPDLAYGSTGFLPRIPPNATLIFHVTLINKITIAEAQATVQAEIATATAEAEVVATEVAATEEAVATEEAPATVTPTAEALGGDDATVTPTP